MLSAFAGDDGVLCSSIEGDPRRSLRSLGMTGFYVVRSRGGKMTDILVSRHRRAARPNRHAQAASAVWASPSIFT